MNRFFSDRRERAASGTTTTTTASSVFGAAHKRLSNGLSIAMGLGGSPTSPSPSPKTQVKQHDSPTGVLSLSTASPVKASRYHTQPVQTRPQAIIESIATGVPEHSRTQTDVAAQVAELFGPDSPHAQRIPRLYAKTRIDKRHRAVDPLDAATFDRAMPIRQRMDLFLEHAAPLAIDVASRAVEDAHVNAANDIGLLVMVTSTGFIAPGVDVALMKALGLDPSVARVVVNFMGCAAAMNGIRTAADYVLARYGQQQQTHKKTKALVVCVELSSVNGVFKETLNDVIISSLFGDGCAALVIGARGEGDGLAPGEIALRGSFSRLVGDTEDGITLGVNADGITCELSPRLPEYIRSAVGPAVEGVLGEYSLVKDDVHLWAIHPGGPKIIEESLASLGLKDEVAALSWDMLARYGNMLSVSLPFVLQRMAAEAKALRPVSTGVAFSFGPGITVEGVVFDIAGASPSGSEHRLAFDAGMLADFSALGVSGLHLG
ncbi:alpha-pyrone synthesis polyketide synthase-like Pks18 [Echria macrotheca]|uniref:Alpha-pyrone synthesis polyketide synthase-like Pks18 n=1 Tax=Echria macrotheca TaxID=438768 RepID=A0AAJ0BG24_9PEZI|nr:alpha-pyrone synthesis polyketide synthase-like Pks18 [Echria macrotheca]